MILVDTVVWLRALRAIEPFESALDALLAAELVLAHEFVYGELLIGDPGGARRGLLRDVAQMTQAPLVAHAEVVKIVRRHALYGTGLSWIDAHLLASALAEDAELWTADRPLLLAAAHVGCPLFNPKDL